MTQLFQLGENIKRRKTEDTKNEKVIKIIKCVRKIIESLIPIITSKIKLSSIYNKTYAPGFSVKKRKDVGVWT